MSINTQNNSPALSGSFNPLAMTGNTSPTTTTPPVVTSPTPTVNPPVSTTGGFNINVPNTIPSTAITPNQTRRTVQDYRSQLQAEFDASRAEQKRLQKQILEAGTPGTDEAQAQRTLLDLQQGLRQGLTNIENQPIAMEFVTGQQSALQKQGALNILAASENLQALTNQRTSLLDNLKTQLGFQQKNFEDYLGLTKEFRSIDKDQRDAARTTLSDIISFAEGKTYDQLDADTQQSIINAVADSPLSLGLVKNALLKGKVAYDEARAKAKGGSGSGLSSLPKESLTRFYQLLDDFDKQTTNQRTVVNNAKNISALAERAKTNPTAQMALVFQYMKALDPSSTVREGEFANAKNTTGIPGKVRNTYNKVLSGKFLTEEQINSFVSDAQKLATTSSEQMKVTAQEFDRRASFAGIPAGMFFEETQTNQNTANSTENPQQYQLADGTIVTLQPDGTYQ